MAIRHAARKRAMPGVRAQRPQRTRAAGRALGEAPRVALPDRVEAQPHADHDAPVRWPIRVCARRLRRRPLAATSSSIAGGSARERTPLPRRGRPA
jgi:hypothetical protein